MKFTLTIFGFALFVFFSTIGLSYAEIDENLTDEIRTSFIADADTPVIAFEYDKAKKQNENTVVAQAE